MTQLPPLLTAAEVADALRVDAATVRRWANDGSIESVRLPGGTFRFPARVLQQFMPPAEPVPA